MMTQLRTVYTLFHERTGLAYTPKFALKQLAYFERCEQMSPSDLHGELVTWLWNLQAQGGQLPVDRSALWPHLHEVQSRQSDSLSDSAAAAAAADSKHLDIQTIVQDKVWVVDNVLSEAECKNIIDATEKHGFDIAETYCHLYRRRRNDRFESDDVTLAEELYRRTLPVIPVHKTGKDGHVYTRKGLNPRFRFCKYTAGHYFGPHIDGSFYKSDSERSFLTFMIYLNDAGDDFTGGCTNFLDQHSFEVTHSIAPKCGRTIVFWQTEKELLHEGEPVTDGLKYMMRTDVMYERTDKTETETETETV
jgi:predicted 2-oxoglutarate/Fe(II)-dependent dioxygenase YbiX